MTILDNGTRNQYTATASQTVFVYDFEIIDDDDIIVDQNGTILTKTTNYTISGVGDDNGGNVTLVTGATAGDIITLYRSTAAERLTDYQQSGSFLASEVNSDFDRLWFVIQEMKTDLNRAIQMAITTSTSLPVTIGEPVAGNLLRWTGTSTLGNIPSSDITPSGSITTDYNRWADGIAAMRALTSSELTDGQIVYNTNATNPGAFAVRTGSVLDDGIDNIVFTDDPNRYMLRITTPASAITTTVQTFTSSGTYTPTSGTVYAQAIVQAGGGGGGYSQPSGNAGAYAISTAGGGGSASIKYFTPSGTYSVTVGAGGLGGLHSGQVDPTSGGVSSLSGTGVSITCAGGNTGSSALAQASNTFESGAEPSSSAGGDLNMSGNGSGNAFMTGTFVSSTSTSGSSPIFGGAVPSNWQSDGSNATAYGAGGGSSAGLVASTAVDGGDGAAGVVIIIDYVSS